MQKNLSKIVAFITRVKGKDEVPQQKDLELLRLLRETQTEIARCQNNLKFADSEALLDMYIYSIKAHELRYAHLLKLAKKTAI